MSLPGHFLFAPSHRIHFIGAGGIGMSGIAKILLTMVRAIRDCGGERRVGKRSGPNAPYGCMAASGPAKLRRG
jgi:hypothetical protein